MRSRVALPPAWWRSRGQVVVLFVLALVPLLALCGLVIDGGSLYVQARTAQNAADAAAYAGAWKATTASASDTTVATAICTYVLANEFGSPTVTVAAQWYNGTSWATINLPTGCSGTPSGTTFSSPTIIQVSVKFQVNTFFLGMIGLGNVSAQAGAEASIIGGPAPDVLYALGSACPNQQGPSSGGIYGYSVSTITIDGGVQDNSTCTSGNDALNMYSASSVSATGAWNVVGSVATTPPSVKPSGTVNAGAASLPDPLASIPVPDVTGLTNRGSVSSCPTSTVQPGYYTSFVVTSCSSPITFAAGNYEFRSFSMTSISGSVTIGSAATQSIWVLDTGMKFDSVSNVTGSNTMFYNACIAYHTSPGTACAPGAYGQIYLYSVSTFDVSAPTSGTYKNLTMFQDRNNTAEMELYSVSNFESGTVYGATMPTELYSVSNATENDQWVVGGLNFYSMSNFVDDPTSAEEASGSLTVQMSE